MSEVLESRAVRRTTAAALVGLLATAFVIFVPSIRFAYRSLAGHLVLETTVTLVSAMVALLLYGRYRRSRALADLLIVCAMALLGVAALVLVTLPTLFGETTGVTASSWAALVVRFVAAVLIVAAALVPDRQVRRDARSALQAVGVAGVLVVITLVVVLVAVRLPEAVDVHLAPQESRPTLEGHPLVLGVQVANFFCYALAAVAFTRRAARRGDDLLGWLGAASALGAWSRIHYLLFPSLYTEWLYVGDLFRLGFYVLLLVGVVREIQRYWAAQADVAAAAERRRLARDLHDSVVQELGYIRQLATATRTTDGDVSDRIIGAADRALDESRRSISALTAEADEPLATTLHRSVSEVCDRYDVPVHFAGDGDVVLPPDDREAVVRIVREAVANAARHAGPSAIWVSLAPGEVTVRDDGRGFAPGGTQRAGSFGLVSMRERAAAMDATLDVESVIGEGTVVKVTW